MEDNSMFIVKLIYKKSLEMVDQHLAVHRNFLEECYLKNALIVSGPLNPRTGGILVSQLNDREALMALIHSDPFYIKDIADYEILEFDPVKYHQNFAGFIHSYPAL
jgi:uncharacterized protein YciI